MTARGPVEPGHGPAAYPVEHPSSGEHRDTTIVLLHGGNVASWMWEPQVAGLADFHLLTPDLPGFGARRTEPWTSLAGAAADVAALIATRARGGQAHVVGLSLGGVVATRLVANHPEVAQSVLISGVPLDGVHGITRRLADLQLRFWEQRWFWQAQARAFGLPDDSRELFVEHGLSVARDAATRMLREVSDGGVPAGLERYPGRLLAIAGGRESASVRRSFPALRRALPTAQCAIAPGMHHAWSIEDAALFTDVVRQWVTQSTVEARLRAG